MYQLVSITDQDFSTDIAAVDVDTFRTREAARAVLLDNDNKVYLLNVTNHDYHKLPGGGIDEGETVHAALARELIEEVGCKAEIVTELGEIVEYRAYVNLKQTSYCFLARQIGQQIDSALEESEVAEGMIEVMTDDIDAAIILLESDKPNNLEGQFIQKRDLHFLRAAKLYLDD